MQVQPVQLELQAQHQLLLALQEQQELRAMRALQVLQELLDLQV
jgi:hypothetical protein